MFSDARITSSGHFQLPLAQRLGSRRPAGPQPGGSHGCTRTGSSSHRSPEAAPGARRWTTGRRSRGGLGDAAVTASWRRAPTFRGNARWSPSG